MRTVLATAIFAVLLTSGGLALAATPDSASDAAAPGLDEIVVTATRQSESISKVPISISAFTPESIEQKGIKSFDEIARFTPGVRFDPGDNSITIRGISSGAGSGTTGIYLDDTPIQMRALGFSADDSLPGIFDLERVEILRGPQGTLFGAGSEGGTVRYITVQPSVTKYSGTARAELATTKYGDLSYEAGAAFGGPIVDDKIGFRVSAWYRRNGGYVDRTDTSTGTVTQRDANHSDITALRGALTFKPTDDLTITPSVLYQRRNVNDTDSFFTAISRPGDGVFLNGSPELRGSRDKFTLPALYVEYQIGSVSLISNTSYFSRDNTTGYDGTLYDLSYYQGGDFLNSSDCRDGTIVCRHDLYPLLQPTGINPALPYYLSPSVVTNRQRNLTQELRLQSNDPSSRFSWVTGLFFQRSKQHSTEELVDPLVNDLFGFLFDGATIEDLTGWPLYQYKGHTDSYINDTGATDEQSAIFADVTYKLTEQLKLTLGGRYARTKYKFANFADGSQNFDRTEAEGRSSENPFTPKAGLSYQIDNDNLVYANYSRGFRQGGANAPVPFEACSDDLTELGLTKSPDTYKSDSVKSFEIGTKSNLLERRVQLAFSAYRVKWTDIQSSVFLSGCAIQFTGNLGEAQSRGFDAQTTLHPTDHLTIDATLGYTDAFYTADTASGSSFLVKENDGLGIPPWTVTIGLEQTFPLFSDQGYVRVDFESTSKVDRPTPNRDPEVQSYDAARVAPPSTNFMSLRTGTRMGDLNLALFVDNLFDSRPQLTYTHQDRRTLLFESTTLRPRTIGVTATYSWR